MTREEWRYAYRIARLRRRSDWRPADERCGRFAAAAAPAGGRGRRLGGLADVGARRTAAWLFVVLTVFAAVIAVWSSRPDGAQEQGMQVSLPAVSSPGEAVAAPTDQS